MKNFIDKILQLKVVIYFMPILRLKVVRYLVPAVTATLVDIGIFYLTFNYIFKQHPVSLLSFTIKARYISKTISFCCGMVTSFTITRIFVFTESEVKAHHQFMRFVMVSVVVFILNLCLMSFLIDKYKWYPTVAVAFSAVSIGMLSFLSHKFFTFREIGGQAADKTA